MIFRLLPPTLTGTNVKNATFLLLSFVAMASVGCQDEVKVIKTKTYKDCQLENLSETFRQTAGDTFDRLQSLETNELEGKMFYQPAEQEADRAVLKIKRVASNPDEVKLSEAIELYFLNTKAYRSTTEFISGLDDLRLNTDPAGLDKALLKTKKEQQLHRTFIAACVMRSYKIENPDYQSLLDADKRRKLEQERYWAARDEAAATAKRKPSKRPGKEPEFVDEPRSKPH